MWEELEHHVHSHGDNWIHFRTPNQSLAYSFTVSYLHDGTTVFSGDLGTLVWRKEPWHIHIGFPFEFTDIGYFTEKCKLAEHDQKIKEFDLGQAIQKVKEYYSNDTDMTDERLSEYIDLLERLDDLEWQEYSWKREELFYEYMRDFDCDSWEYDFRDYTFHFRLKYELLKKYSLIIRAIFKNGVTV